MIIMVYHDAYEIYELLDAWNHQGPPKTELVQELFQRDASAAQQVFASGKTLLHKCLEYYSHELALVKLFCQYHTAALTLRDAEQQQLPLHIAVQPPSWDAKLAVVQYLVEQAPETVFMPDRQGRLPLHIAATAENASVVQYLLSLFPEAVQWRDNAHQFPIDHALAAQCPNADIVQLLLKPFPTVLSFYDMAGSLRLHQLLAHRCDDHNPVHAKLIQVITDAFPAALSLQDFETHQTPLFQACVNDNPLSQIYTLLRQWPEQVSIQRKQLIWNDAAGFNGELVSAGLVAKHMTVDRVRQWYSQSSLHSTTTLTKIPPDATGRLPLHYAACSEASSGQVVVTMIEFLLEHDKSAVQHQDVYGRLPLHYAVMSPQQDEHVVDEIIQILVDAYPAGLLVRDKEQRLPWHYAEAVRLSVSLLDMTRERFSGVEEDWELVPEEIHWDIGRIVVEDV